MLEHGESAVTLSSNAVLRKGLYPEYSINPGW